MLTTFLYKCPSERSDQLDWDMCHPVGGQNFIDLDRYAQQHICYIMLEMLPQASLFLMIYLNLLKRNLVSLIFKSKCELEHETHRYFSTSNLMRKRTKFSPFCPLLQLNWIIIYFYHSCNVFLPLFIKENFSILLVYAFKHEYIVDIVVYQASESYCNRHLISVSVIILVSYWIFCNYNKMNYFRLKILLVVS